jgi:hypothetical protein
MAKENPSWGYDRIVGAVVRQNLVRIAWRTGHTSNTSSHLARAPARNKELWTKVRTP